MVFLSLLAAASTMGSPAEAVAASVSAADEQMPQTQMPPTATTTQIAAPPSVGEAGQAQGVLPEILVKARTPSPADPVEAVNVESYKVVQAVDEAVIAPVTHGYMRAIPKPAQDGLHNLISNLDEPIVFVNFLLQLKPGKAIETAGRFVINTTVGLGGLFDVAKRKPINLPRRSNGLADTLGYYGVKPGPFLFLPLIGPTTVRDVIARPLDLAILPFLAPKPFGNPAVALGKGVLSALDERAQSDERLNRLRYDSPDGYYAIREDYLKRRQNEIYVLKGKCRTINDPPCGPWAPPSQEVHGQAPVVVVPDGLTQ